MTKTRSRCQKPFEDGKKKRPGRVRANYDFQFERQTGDENGWKVIPTETEVKSLQAR